MSLKFLCLSDLHLGEVEGLLYHKDNHNIADLLSKKIAEITMKNDGRNHIAKLVLNGDIIDLAMSSPEESKENASFFFESLFNKVDINEIIFIPGNHDHHVWIDVAEHYAGKKFRLARKTGIIKDKDRITERYFLPQKYHGKVYVAYPHYVYDDEENCIMFHHGHFVCPSILRWFLDNNSLTPAKLEEKLWNKIELVWWHLPKLNPVPEIVWEKLNIVLHAIGGKSYRGTTFLEDALPLTEHKLIGNIIWYIEKIARIKRSMVVKNFHFVLGHTHFGGRLLKEDRACRIMGHFVNIWNTGAWLVPYGKWSPDAIILYYSDKQGLNYYKMVSKSGNEKGEGDYSKKILAYRAKFIGK